MSKTSFLIITFASALLCACTIKDETSKEERFSIDLSEIERHQNKFIQDANKCIKGDLSNLDKIVFYFKESQQNLDSPYALSLQTIKNNAAFEKCAQKALSMGNDKAFKAMVTKQGQAARLSCEFYARDDYTNGAFWYQRVINLKGPRDGYEILGRRFVQNPKTQNMGAKLLQESARLGNRTALEILMSLTDESSLNYISNDE